MSLEQKIEALTAALEDNTAALLSGEAAPKTAAKKPAAKKQPPEEEEEEDEPAPKKKAAAKKKPAAKKKSGPSAETLKDKTTEYLRAGDKDARATASDNVAAILEYLEAEKVSAVEEGDFKEYLEMLQLFVDGESPFDD